MKHIMRRKEFNKMVLDATYKAQKKYGFEIGSGELIYVDNYVRANGTKVNGYYRRTPYNKSKSQN